MKRRPKRPPAAPTRPRRAAHRAARPVQTRPNWHTLPPKQKQALTVALAALMVKLLPVRPPQQQEVNDA